MATSMEELVSFVPAALVRRLETCQPPSLGPSIERVPGAALFADITGFTALTERLATRGPAGTEELSNVLNAYFALIIDEISVHGGDVVKMAGDALIALWPPLPGGTLAQAALRASACGLAIQGCVGRFQSIEGVRLAVRIGLGAGEVTLMHVGGVLGRWELLVCGPPLVQMGVAEHGARPGDVVVSPEAWALVRSRCVGAALAHGCVRLERVPNPEPARPLVVAPPPIEAAALLRSYLPGAIQARLVAGQKAWLSELRRITTLFVNLPGLGGSLETTHRALQSLQDALYEQEGSLNKLSIDEKGITLVAALGLPPLAHEDDPARAVLAALAMQSKLRDLEIRGSFGITTGRVYCGEVGSLRRREYTIIGDAVNLAARLMQAANGEILCDQATCEAAQGRLRFEARDPIRVKGKAEPIPIHEPVGTHKPAPTPGPGNARPIIGRLRERINLAGRLDALALGTGALVVIEGEVGIGKSRLIAEVLELARSKKVACLTGAGDVIEGTTPYHAWRPVLTRLLGADGIGLESLLNGRPDGPELRRMLPLLNSILPLRWPEDEITAQMTGKVRADNVNGLAIRLLADAARRAPTILVLEDGHWFDSATWSLIQLAAQEIPELLIVLSTRPLGDPLPPEYDRLFRLGNVQRMPLGALSPEELETLICERLGADRLAPQVRALALDTARGNPYFGEEIAHGLSDSGLIVVEDGVGRLAEGIDPQAVSLPDNLQGIITSRLDRLSPPQQVSLKTASVIGRSFAYRLLHDVHPIPSDKARLPEYLGSLERLEMIDPESSEAASSYAFRNVVIKEVCYNSMLFAQRRQLHRAIAEWYETRSAGVATLAPLMAYHWGKAEERERQVEYLDRAGSEALRSGANAEAVVAMTEAIALHVRRHGADPSGDERFRRGCWERRLGEALYGLGRLSEAKVHLERALGTLGRPVPCGTGRIMIDIAAQVARQLLFRLGLRRGAPLLDASSDEEGGPEVVATLCLERLSVIRYFTSEIVPGLDLALRALNTAEARGNTAGLARSFSGMGVVMGLLGLHPGGRYYTRRAVELAQDHDHLPTRAYVLMVSSMFMLGIGRWADVEAATDRCLLLCRQLGDRARLVEELTIQAMLACFRAKYPLAASLFETIEESGRRNENPLHQAWGACGRGEALMRLGRLDASLGALDDALRLLRGENSHTEEIRAHGFRSAVLWRLGRQAEALDAAGTTVELASRYSTNTCSTLEGNACASEVVLSAWEQGRRSGDVRSLIRRASGLTGKNARIFPIGRPRHQLLEGRSAWLFGRRRRALSCWQRGLVQAQRMELPLDEGLAHLELGRHLDPGDPDRPAHLEAAALIFERLETPHEREQARSILLEEAATS